MENRAAKIVTGKMRIWGLKTAVGDAAGCGFVVEKSDNSWKTSLFIKETNVNMAFIRQKSAEVKSLFPL